MVELMLVKKNLESVLNIIARIFDPAGIGAEIYRNACLFRLKRKEDSYTKTK